MVSERMCCCWRYFFNEKVAYVKKGIQKAQRRQRHDKSLYTEDLRQTKAFIHREVLLLLMLIEYKMLTAPKGLFLRDPPTDVL
jgi:hypothetical protein